MRHLRDDGILGRDHPAAVLRAEVDRVLSSHGGLVLVAGEAGIGKTTLVTAAAAEARRRGALVLSGSCWDSDAAPGYWPWVQVIRSLRRGASEAERQAVEAAAGAQLNALLGESPAGEGGDPDVDDATAFHLYDAVTTSLVCVSQSRPVVVVLDDLHWADPASVRLLEFAVRHTWFEAVLLIGTYRDVEVEAADHALRPRLAALLSKATSVTLTGLGPAEVAALMTRTTGREPEPALAAEVHRRTGGNPFFVEQTARLWRSGASTTAIAPGVRDAVRRRLALLPEPVLSLLTVASVLGQEFERPVLAACASAPVPQVDRLLDRAVATRLIIGKGDGRFVFAHDIVRETLYDELDEVSRRRWHAAVTRTMDTSPALAGRRLPADVARHVYLAGADIEADRAVDLLLAAAHDAGTRLAFDEAVVHLRRAFEVAEDPSRRARIALELGRRIGTANDHEETWGFFDEAARVARELEDTGLLARVALTAYRHAGGGAGRSGALLREAHAGLLGASAEPVATDRLVREVIAAAEASARLGRNDDALTFSLRTRHDLIWGLGTAREREALTIELGLVARRNADRETELYAASLRWVAQLELGDPAYHRQLLEFVALSDAVAAPRSRLAAAIDQATVATLRGDFAEVDAWLDATRPAAGAGAAELGYLGHHVRWASRLLQGRYAEVAEHLDQLTGADHRDVALLRAITAAELGDAEPGLRYLTTVDESDPAGRRYLQPLLLRLRAQVAAITGDLDQCGAVRDALGPYRGEWAVSLYGCDVSGPIDHWIAVVDAAAGRWDDAVLGFTAAADAADRLQSRPWSITARAGLAGALAGRSGPGDAAAAGAVWAGLRDEAEAAGMAHIAERAARADAPAPDAVTARADDSSAPPTQPAPASTVDEFRRDGGVWRLRYGGRLAHLPDAKGLHDLHLLLGCPGHEVPAIELLDPAAGPELVVARRMGADPVLDEEAKAQYKRRLEQLDELIDRAVERGETGRAAEFEDERKALLGELRAAAGLAGRRRRLGDEAERARKAVTARIRDTLRRLDEHHPELATHLRESVSTGAMCRYQPASAQVWRL